MKKLFTASLVAMMAVSAANADIASTKYVTDRTGNTTFTGSVSTAADLTAAVNALAGKVDTVAGSGTGSVSEQIASALENYDTSSEVDGKISNATKDMATDGELSSGLALKEDVSNKVADTYTSGSETQYTSVKAAESIANKAVAASAAQLGDLADLDVVTTDYITDKNVTKAKLADDVQASLGKADNSVQTSTYNADKSATDAAIADLVAADTQIAKDYAAADTALKTELQGKIDGVASAAGTNLTEALKDYSTTTQMNTAISNANSAQTTSITNAYEAADSALDTKLSKAISDGDAATLNSAKEDATAKANAAQSAAIAAAATDATTKADAAQSAAIAAAATDAADKYQAKSTTLSIGEAGGKWTDLTKAANYATTGTFSLVLKDGTIAWEQVSY